MKKKIIAWIMVLVMIFSVIPSNRAYAATTKMSKCKIALSKTTFDYTGSACKPTVTVTYKKKTLKKNKDYTISYKNNVNPGTATVLISGKGKYAGTVKKSFKIKNALSVKLSKKKFTYTGQSIKPAFTVKYGSKKLTTKDYSVTYKKNTNAGTAQLIVKGKGKYKKKNACQEFLIMPASIAMAKVSLPKTTFTYTGKALEPAPVVKLGTRTLLRYRDYTVRYEDNTKVGKATIWISGKGNYAGSVKAQFTIVEVATTQATTEKPTETTTEKATEATTEKPTEATTEETTETPTKGIYPETLSLQTVEDAEKGYVNKGYVTVYWPKDEEAVCFTSVKDPTEESELYPRLNPYCSVEGNSDSGVGVNGNRKFEIHANDATGDTEVYFKVGDTTFTCKVHVEKIESTPGGDNPVEDDPGRVDNLDAAGKTGYVGERASIGLGDKLKNSDNPITWASQDESIAIIKPMPEGKVDCVDDNDALIDFVAPGTTVVSATDGETTEICTVTVKPMDDGYMYSVVKGAATYTVQDTTIDTTGMSFEQNQDAASVINAPELEQAERGIWNHPSGMAYYRKDDTSYLFVADAYNNRVLCYTGNTLQEIRNTDWEASENEAKIIVLGQQNITDNVSGYGNNQLNWPMDVAVDQERGWLYIADTRNNRVVVYDDITKLTTGCAFDHKITWFQSDHSNHNQQIQWPWAISTSKEGSLMVANTCGTKLHIWDNIPETWEEKDANDQFTENYYPNLVLDFGVGTTPRAVFWTGEQLFIGDENIQGYGAGNRVINGWPTAEKMKEKAAASEHLSYQEIKNDGVNVDQVIIKADQSGEIEDFIYGGAYGIGTMVNGKLYLQYANNVHIWNDGKVDGVEDKPDLVLGTINARYSEETGFFFCGGAVNEMMYEEGDILIMLSGPGLIVGFTEEPTAFNAMPDIRMGGVKEFDIDAIESHSNYVVGLEGQISTGDRENPDDDYMVLSNELDKRLSFFKGVPTSSGAQPISQFYYNYMVPGEVAVAKQRIGANAGKTAAITITRNHGVLYIWDDIEEALQGKLPRILANQIGSVGLTNQITSLDYDGTYFAVTQTYPDRMETYIWYGIPEKEDDPIAIIQQGGKVNLGAGRITLADGSNVDIYDMAPLATYVAEGTHNNIYQQTDAYGFARIQGSNGGNRLNFSSGEKLSDRYYRVDGYPEFTEMHATDVVISDDIFAIAELHQGRVLIWDNVEAAIANEQPAVIGHGAHSYTFNDIIDNGEEIYDTILASSKDTIVMPNTLMYDGVNLFVCEFKFGNRILRFAK